MIRITKNIDKSILSKFPGYGLKLMGLAELVNKETSRFPVTISNREKVAIDDAYDGLVYHRVISSATSLNPDYDYGLTIAVQYTVTLRTFLAYKVDKGESFKYAFRNVFPSSMNVSGFEYAYITPGSINEDHEGIVRDEFTEIPYHKHRLPWNVVSYDNSIEFILCKHDCIQNV